ncbi:TetR/AcrR family transcriptional regulator [Agromyces sp. SYSU K20354]|uniref:TetR/AcrR family transcriptional regulator n=1 Tax=Agromyces cavernae TaxID=2898659 RepID=UPI001E3FBAC2|nr:TetR/AcrR family transcriptional regulator [Agromyces cavernae]MCD2443105.1 TetR/AcrR family transcriptional regulator [Agromyces cavernae]
MREWIPISTSPKGRLALAAVQEFGARPFDEVTVGELAAAATVTTGALYHHFGSKLGLYAFVRDDVEQRMLDRMEGAIAASPAPSGRSTAVMAALLIGFDFAVREGFLRILGDPPAGADHDRLAELLNATTTPASPVLGRVLAAAWRAALVAVAEGSDSTQAREALAALEFRLAS